MPFVLDPFLAPSELPMVIGTATSSDWMRLHEAAPRYTLAYYSFDRRCRRSPVCQGQGEIHCDVRTFGKLGVIQGKPVILSEVTTSQQCEGIADLKRRHASMHDSLIFEDVEQFDGSEPRPIPKFPPLSLTLP